MSRPGLLRSLRDFFRELRSFGNPELDNLKTHARALQRELDELEAMRAAREKQEEAFALMQLQSTVQNMQQLDKIMEKSEKMIVEAVEKAGAQTDEHVKVLLQQKAQEVVGKLDLTKALSLDIPPEQIVADAMQQASAQLQAESGQEMNLTQSRPHPPQQATNLQGAQHSNSSSLQSKQLSGAAQHGQKRQLHQQTFCTIAWVPVPAGGHQLPARRP